MSDVLIMTFGLLAAVVYCLAKPCSPARWTCVKAPHRALDALPAERELVPEPAPSSEPGFADGLTAAV